ncbi:MAG: hypothetical protein KF796_19290 [Ramlibacter sp.]|nr:hypothetical protein [Ramlibacter sp.]
MSSKRAIRRQYRRKSCQGKVRHADEVAAKVALRMLHQNRGYQGFMSAYSCKFCGGWHIGHVPVKDR